MNPMTNMKNVLKLSAQELKTSNKTSWHDQYKGSAWIFVGGLPYDLTEGDIISVFSQYGEIVNINLVRDKISGKQKGFCFICYEDQRSTVLAVDNFNGIKVLGRTIRVDHVNDYKPPKDGDKLDEETKKIHRDGCGPVVEHVKIKPEPVFEPEAMIVGGVRLPPRLPIGNIKTEIKTEPELDEAQKKHKVKKEKRKKEKKSKKSKSNKKRRRKSTDDSDNCDSRDSDSENEDREKRKKK